MVVIFQPFPGCNSVTNKADKKLSCRRDRKMLHVIRYFTKSH